MDEHNAIVFFDGLQTSPHTVSAFPTAMDKSNTHPQLEHAPFSKQLAGIVLHVRANQHNDLVHHIGGHHATNAALHKTHAAQRNKRFRYWRSQSGTFPGCGQQRGDTAGGHC